jgi:hypothetical protein
MVCLQGDMLLSMLWNLVVDGLLMEFNKGGYYVIEYSGDIAVLINGKFPDTSGGIANSPRTRTTIVR